jgi:hypothetical protein
LLRTLYLRDLALFRPTQGREGARVLARRPMPPARRPAQGQRVGGAQAADTDTGDVGADAAADDEDGARRTRALNKMTTVERGRACARPRVRVVP